jgi:asparagine synthase (glutamine-hydrolysing)
MCGIAGTVRIGDRALIERMTAMMTYRGPDDAGIYEDGDVRLGNRRLAILDLSAAGHQPMESDDGQVVVTFNGEIYNYPRLRDDLEARGHKFRSDSDTESIVHAYREYGVDCLEHLDGMFGFALWDRRLRQLLLARDHIGIKPVFYYTRGDGLAFASELKPLLCLPELERRVNRRALRAAIRYASNLEDESLLASVYKLPPGCRLIWKAGVSQVAPYWRHPDPRAEACDVDVAASELRDRLTRVVRSHMISDAPLGAALSGGLDSSGIVALMAQEATTPVETFTVGHGADDPDLLSARLVADHCRTNHHEIVVAAENIVDLLPQIVWHLEEPLGQMETVQMYVNYREAARFVKVLMVGEGADECFAGYARYHLLRRSTPLPLATQIDLYRRVYMHADEAPPTFVARLAARALWGAPPVSPMSDPRPRLEPPLIDTSSRYHALERALAYDRRTILPHLYLKRADGLSMAHSLEVRVPFLDRSIVELASRLPAPLLVRGRTEKYLLRRALAPLLPPAVAWRGKHPLQMRVTAGLMATLVELAGVLLRPADVRRRGFFDPDRVGTILRQRPGRLATGVERKFWAWRVWSMLLCEVWARLFLDRPIGAAPPMRLRDLT